MLTGRHRNLKERSFLPSRKFCGGWDEKAPNPRALQERKERDEGGGRPGLRLRLDRGGLSWGGRRKFPFKVPETWRRNSQKVNQQDTGRGRKGHTHSPNVVKEEAAPRKREGRPK